MGGTQQYWLPENTAYQQLMDWLAQEPLTIELELDKPETAVNLVQFCDQRQLSKLAQLVESVERESGLNTSYSRQLRTLLS